MYKKQRVYWRNNYLYLLLIIFVIITDQLSKYYFIHLFETAESYPQHIGAFLNFQYAWNTGMSFSLFANKEYSNLLFIITSIIITGYFLKLFLYETNRNIKLSYSLIIGGAIGNIIDRIDYGAVFDFIELHIKEFYWPVFNLADSYITIGAFLLIYSLFFNRPGRHEKK